MRDAAQSEANVRASRDLHGVSLDSYWLAGEGLPDIADSYLEGYRLAEIGRQAELMKSSFRDGGFSAPYLGDTSLTVAAASTSYFGAAKVSAIVAMAVPACEIHWS